MWQVAQASGSLAFVSRTFGEPLRAEITLLDHTFGPRRVFGIEVVEERTRVPVIEAAGAKGAGRHTEPAADTAMKIHQNDTVRLALPR